MELENLRSKIDKIDLEIIHLLSQRFEVSRKIGEFKKLKSLPVVDESRWTSLLRDRIEMAKSEGLPDDLIQELFEIIHKHSIRSQN